MMFQPATLLVWFIAIPKFGSALVEHATASPFKRSAQVCMRKVNSFDSAVYSDGHKLATASGFVRGKEYRSKNGLQRKMTLNYREDRCNDDVISVPSINELFNNNSNSYSSETRNTVETTRRRFMIATAIAAAGMVSSSEGMKNLSKDSIWNDFSFGSKQHLDLLESSSVKKRSDVKTFDAKNYGYNPYFIDYLSKFLLNYDYDCQQWWQSKVTNSQKRATSGQKLNEITLEQFAAFSASVEIGLQEFSGADGPRRLMDELLNRYCHDRAIEKQPNKIAEVRRHIAVLFALLETNQPVESISKLLELIETDGKEHKTGGRKSMPFQLNFAANTKKGVLPQQLSPTMASMPSPPQILDLIPQEIMLEYNSKLKRYTFDLNKKTQSSGFDLVGLPSFSENVFQQRRGAPIERKKNLDQSTLIKFFAAGALCSSVAHLTLMPVDVLKTKVQTNPEKYPEISSALSKVWVEEGLGTFFTGWLPTFLGFLVWGGVSYTSTEFLHRLLSDFLNSSDGNNSLEVFSILASSSLAACLGSFVICPFEAVRIRSVAQPGYASNIFGVIKRMTEEEGFFSLFDAVPAFLLKEIPFACAKFSVFTLSTAKLYEMFPEASNDLQSSLMISLLGGTLGGIAAAVVSNPADATISEMKKIKSKIGAVEAAKALMERGGVSSLFKGLGLRFFSVSMLVSFQFFVYDFVRFTLGIAADDLILYLNVLGAALSEAGNSA